MRFLDTLGQQPHHSACRAVFDALVKQLGAAVPGLGQHTAGDSTARAARAKRDTEAVAGEVAQGLPQPSGGRKEYRDEDGTVTTVYEWFGYQLHLLVDTKHEVALAYHVSDTKTPDNQGIAPLLDQAVANLGEGRIETLAYDKAADDSAEALRRFPPIPRAPVQFERRYAGRTAVARVNARFKIFWGVDDGNLSGAPRFHACVGAVMVVHAALAKWLAKQPRWEGTLGHTRLGPAALALARLEAHMEEPKPAAT